MPRFDCSGPYAVCQFPEKLRWVCVAPLWDGNFLEVKEKRQETPAKTSLRSCNKRQLLSWLTGQQQRLKFLINSNCIVKSRLASLQSPNAIFFLWETSTATQSLGARSKSNANFCLVDNSLSPFPFDPSLAFRFSIVWVPSPWKKAGQLPIMRAMTSVAVINNYHVTRVVFLSVTCPDMPHDGARIWSVTERGLWGRMEKKDELSKYIAHILLAINKLIGRK